MGSAKRHCPSTLCACNASFDPSVFRIVRQLESKHMGVLRTSTEECSDHQTGTTSTREQDRTAVHKNTAGREATRHKDNSN